MLNLLSKKKLLQASEVVLDVPVVDFIPYACHYDHDTILTKNGELLQVIKVTGFSSEIVGSSCANLRSIVRKSICSHVDSQNFALSFHTIRKTKNLDPGGHYSNDFSYSLNKVWKDRNEWDHKYVNELHITILHRGSYVKKFDIAAFISAFIFTNVKKKQLDFLHYAHDNLVRVVNNMLLTLQEFGAKRLTMVEENKEYYSEQLEFFAKIINLAEVQVQVEANDLSNCLASHKIAFGFNTMEVRNEEEKKFGAIFTIKNYHEIPSSILDNFLQLPQEFIITQTADFINTTSAVNFFKKQYNIYLASDSKELASLSGLKYMMDSARGEKTDYCQTKITIMLIADNIENLNKNISAVIDVFNKLGIIAIRNDLRLEEAFWGQLPGNFLYTGRSEPVPITLLGGFASLYNFPAGRAKGNYWGPPVTAFYTAGGTPYFFNFHVGKCGHTTIIGPFGSGKTVLLNFLVSESRKFNGRLFFFDQMRVSKVFIKAMGGEYNIVKPAEPDSPYRFNPFTLLDNYGTLEVKEFLVNWLSLLLDANDKKVDSSINNLLIGIVDYIASLPKELRILRNVGVYLHNKGEGELAKSFSPWLPGGKYDHLFDNVEDNLILSGKIYGFGCSYILEDHVNLGPVLAYLFFRIELVLDGSPTIIVLDEAWRLIDNSIFAPKLDAWLEKLKKLNTIVIFATQSVNDASSSNITSVIVQNIVTQIFMPNQDAIESSKAYKQVWGLQEQEFEMLSAMKAENRQFMLRQTSHSVVASLNLKGAKEIHVLSGGDNSVKLMEEAIAGKSSLPEDWLPLFYELATRRKK